jgi:uncharacterized protein (DUF1778 family)
MNPKTPDPMLTSTISVRLTEDERRTLEQRADQDDRSVSNYVRKQLRNALTQEGASR